MKRLVRELIIFSAIFVIAALGVHFKAWIDHPIEHIGALSSSSMGVWHPLFLTFIIYLAIGVIRGGIYFFRRVFVK